MGVTGLWKLIEPCGKPVPVETLEGKVLAVDISIWLHQVIKGFQDSKGSALSNAHLLGLFHRLCKLLYYRVRPVFVFDGCVPQLKRDTIAKRQMQRSKLNNEAERLEALLLQALAKEKIVQQALGVATAAELAQKSPLKNKKKSARLEDEHDIFKLPDLPADSCLADKNADASNDGSSFTTDDYSSTDDSSFDATASAYNANLQAIDVRSQHFRNLPADVRHEILVDIKETRKQSSWGRLHELPARSDDFSQFQMKRLLKRRAVQESLEEAEKEMGGRTLTFAELNCLLSEEGIVEPAVLDSNTKQISSDENTRFLLVRDLKKKLTKVKEEDNEQEQEEPATCAKMPKLETDTVKTETLPETKEKSPEQNVQLGNEYEKDLQLAIALSLEQDSHVYSQSDYHLENGENLKLNKEQRVLLRNAAIGPAKAYMIEYAGMNEDEVVGIMEKTQVCTQHGDDTESSIFDDTVVEREEKRKRELLEAAALAQQTQYADITESITVIEETSDSDLEEVKEISIKTHAAAKSAANDDSDTDSDLEEVTANAMEIVLDIKAPIAPDDDLFADVFDDKPVESSNTDSDVMIIDANSQTVNELENSTKVNETNNLQSIMAELAKQKEEIKNLTLDDIALPTKPIELSDDENAIANEKEIDCKQEIIEICDSDDGCRAKNSTNPQSKSPNLTTPTKNKSITEFFDTKYIVKRTPEKLSEAVETAEEMPKVKSPFFVNKKTPKSAQKRAANKSDDESETSKSKSKATKTLFESNNENEQTELGVELLKDIEKPATKSAEELIIEAADALKQQKTDVELQTMAADLAKERRDLESERNRQDRMGMSINQRMSSECQELLRLFGVPYIVAPMEAEAQCAFLDAIELTNGTITDDSDIWLFGGRTVYKNFFAQDKHVLEFKMEKIQQSFHCDRKKLIQLACLVGSDYTTGVHGIGAVTALEILALFSKEMQTEETSGRGNIDAVISALCKFRDWWYASKSAAAPPGSSARLSLLKKLKNIDLHDGFPNVAVAEAYLCPTVDDNKEAFTWGHPDVQSLREFTKKTFGWTTSKTDDILNPVIRKLNEKKSQATLRNYFTIRSTVSAQNSLQVSKRVQQAIERMSAQAADDEETPEKVIKEKPTRKRATRKSAKPAGIATENMQDTSETTTTSISKMAKLNIEIESQTTDSSSTATKTATRSKKTPRIPNTKQVIPQREQDLEQLRKNKEKAVEILKATEKAKKKRGK